MEDIVLTIMFIGGAFFALGGLVYLIWGEKNIGLAVGLAMIGIVIFVLGSNLPLIIILVFCGLPILIMLFLFGGSKPPNV